MAYDPITQFASIKQLADSERSSRDRALGRVARLFRRVDTPANIWMAYVVANAYSTARGVASLAQTQNFRNVRDKSLYRDGEKKVTQGTNNGVGPAPAEYGWFTHEETIRVFAQRAELSAHQQNQPATSWMGFAANIFYDPLTMSGWIEPLGGFRPGSSIKYRQDTNRDITWALSIQQQLVGWSAISQLADSFRLVRDRSLFWDGEKKAVQGTGTSGSSIQEFDPQVDQWVIPNHRTRGKPYWTSVGPSIDWINNPVSQGTFNPATHPWAIHSHYTRQTRPKQMSWTKSGFFISLFYNPAQAHWLVDSQRVPGGPYWTSPDPSVDWIPPVVRVPFDTTQRADVIEHQRVPHAPYWSNNWQGNDWINPALLAQVSFDPRTEDWGIKTSTYESRAWWSDSPLEQAWLVPSAVASSALWSATGIPSHRLWPETAGRWQPDIDNAWQQANPVIPVTFISAFSTQSNELLEPGNFGGRLNAGSAVTETGSFILEETGNLILNEDLSGYLLQEEP